MTEKFITYIPVSGKTLSETIDILVAVRKKLEHKYDHLTVEIGKNSKSHYEGDYQLIIIGENKDVG